jgi:adenylate cyclase
MAREIEHKFLVDTSLWHPVGPGVAFRQGYLSVDPARVVRVRTVGAKAYLTLKGPGHISRAEFEYEIPVDDANFMLDHLCLPGVIAKTRYKQPVGAHMWEIDVFHDANTGLVLAEVELGGEGEAFECPAWALREVSDDPRYFNAALSQRPFKTWA